MKGELTRLRGGYLMTWEVEAVSLAFDSFRADRHSGEVACYVTARSTLPSANGVLHGARLNLSSTRAITEYAKYLSGRTPGTDLDWTGLVAEAALVVRSEHRNGEPHALLREAQEPEGDSYAIAPLLLARHSTTWFGDGGSLKSYLALAAGLSLHMYTDLLGIEPSTRLRVGYFDAEFTAIEHKRRMVALLGPSHELPDFVYVPMVGPLSNQVERCQRIIDTERLDFGIFDSAGLLTAGPPEEAASALEFFQALNELRIGSLLIAHVNKQGDADKPFGSAFWHNSSRLTWYVKREQEHDSDTVEVGLFNRKNNIGPLHRPRGFKVTFELGRTRITRLDLRGVEAFARDVPLADRIARALESGAKTYEEIADITGAPLASVRAKVSTYDGKRFAVMPGTNRKKLIGLLDSRHEPERQRPVDLLADFEIEAKA